MTPQTLVLDANGVERLTHLLAAIRDSQARLQHKQASLAAQLDALQARLDGEIAAIKQALKLGNTN